jgi:hypothetical protein
MVFIVNMGKIIFEKTETRILREIALIKIPEDSPEKIVRLVKGIKSASGIADIYIEKLELQNIKESTNLTLDKKVDGIINSNSS